MSEEDVMKLNQSGRRLRLRGFTVRDSKLFHDAELKTTDPSKDYEI